MSLGDIAAPDLALIAGTGALPALLMRARPDMLLCELEGFASGIPGPSPCASGWNVWFRS